MPFTYPMTIHVAPNKGLRSGALTLGSSIVLGVASTAPAYSLAASLGFIVLVASGTGIIGVQAPAIILLAFIPILFVAIGYQQLNKAEPDCGTTFTWGARAFGPRIGWMGGWGIIVADIVGMSNLAQVAGQYTFDLFGLTDMAQSLWPPLLVGVAFSILVTWICVRGIVFSAVLQKWLLLIEMVMLVIFAVIALVKVYSNNAVESSIMPEWSWFSPAGITSSGLVTGLLIAVFLYWGWDSSSTVNEETENPETVPGKAGVISTLLLLVTFALVAVAAIAFGGVGTSGLGLGNIDNADDVFAALGPSVFGDGLIGRALVSLLIISVLSSATASMITTITPTARTALSMAAFKAIPERFAGIHPRYLTPTAATIWIGVVGTVFSFVLSLVSENVLADSISSVGLMIAFYYGLTGITCAWFYRKRMHSFSQVMLRGVMPGIGGLVLLAGFVLASVQFANPDYGYTTMGDIGGVFVIGIGSLLVGVVLMVIWNFINPSYFRGQTLPKADASMMMPE